MSNIAPLVTLGDLQEHHGFMINIGVIKRLYWKGYYLSLSEGIFPKTTLVIDYVYS